jgi:RNA polymerase sigma-70 factor (ECF subfamily)
MQRDLVERARKGDHDAFSVLAGAAISRLDSAAWLILRDPDQAKDAVQNALVRAWRDLPTLRDPDRFDAWLHRLLVRACIDEARRLRRHRMDVELHDLHVAKTTVAGLESAIVDRDQLERGFLRLDPEMRAVLVLHHYLDLTLPDVAVALGIPLGTAKSRLHRALGLMRAALDADARGRAELSEGRSA